MIDAESGDNFYSPTDCDVVIFGSQLAIVSSSDLENADDLLIDHIDLYTYSVYIDSSNNYICTKTVRNNDTPLLHKMAIEIVKDMDGIFLFFGTDKLSFFLYETITTKYPSTRFFPWGNLTIKE